MLGSMVTPILTSSKIGQKFKMKLRLPHHRRSLVEHARSQEHITSDSTSQSQGLQVTHSTKFQGSDQCHKEFLGCTEFLTRPHHKIFMLSYQFHSMKLLKMTPSSFPNHQTDFQNCQETCCTHSSSTTQPPLLVKCSLSASWQLSSSCFNTIHEISQFSIM